jgi:pimeloyl-ACP methyl ester carboxylesterase
MTAALHPKSQTTRAIVAGALAGAGLVASNHLIARRTERNHAPTGKFVTVDGVRLHYTERGTGSPVVLIHGNAVMGDDWDTSGVSELLSKDNRVISFDRPGCGHSERPRGKLWTAAQQGDLISRALEELKVERPVLVGHSWGTLAALSMAQRHRNGIAGLVLVSGYYFWTLRPDVLLVAGGALPGFGDILRYTFSPLLGWLQMPLLKRAMFSPASVPARFDDEYSPAMVLRPSQIRATSIDGAMMIPSVVALQSGYDDLDVPVAIIAGDGDKIVFKRGAERLHRRLKGSTLEIVKGAGHMVHHFAPAKVANAVDRVQKAAPSQSARPR